MQPFLRHMQPVSLRVGEGEDTGWYPSLVLDFEEGGEILVGVPAHRGYEVRVERGTVVEVQTTQADGLRVFACAVLGRQVEPSPALRLGWPASVRRVQRRETVRVAVMVPVEVRFADADGEPRALPGSTMDLSEGGMRCALAEPVEPGTEMEVRVLLPGTAPVECTGQVIRGGENEAAAAERRWWAAVAFTGASPAARRELTRFVFDTQREHLRKGVA
jgi:c-di-GMP-binding flagellar brake protein YcgR